ncbi:hypothetical protein PQJ75_00775 [Rhodoplanes sp. TEM]|uniref:Uncharacterized protein n=1 Tax=Rhodoplanes tepidamans TaxID=200616 RepID=A0ABT5J563_RHOTP|nr:MULTISPECIES: hypothetical protein [Rhodoplanes]MDC7784786.1 hypothetical protein [Rhodoplanes tepidamans]MDC7982253.1 hypothetical protein [Rhodoplanes sp. TEM]MDQ0356260.1 hypothetical protein [Rhodoplanes tepidamans]
MPDLVRVVRDYAREHYFTTSWDLVADVWTDDEIAEAIRGARTRRGAIAKAWGRLQHIDRRRPAWERPRRPVSLFQFLAGRGGLRPDGDIRYILDGIPLVPGRGALIRSSGMTLDRAREAAAEAGYLRDPAWDRGVSRSSINELLAAIHDEAHGRKRYPIGEEPPEWSEPDHEFVADCPF